ncbi:MAG: hypothetical protein AB7K24_24605 [Gemmataceae bacterium]
MLHIACKQCGQQVEVADGQQAATMKCPQCGLALPGGDSPADRTGGVVDVMVNAYDGYVAATGNRVLFTREEAERLPMVCMCCGVAATERVDKLFGVPKGSEYQYFADWMSSGSYQKAQSPWVRIGVPLCPAHRYEFWWQKLHFVLMALGVFAFVAVLFGLLHQRQLFDLGLSTPELEIALYGVAVGVGFYSLIRVRCSLQVSSFYQNYVEMRYVAKEFAVALAEQRRGLRPAP